MPGKRADIRIDSIGDWNAYASQEPGEAIALIHARAQNHSQQTRDWYWRSIRSKRFASLAVRLVGFMLLVLGAALPILAGIISNAEERLLFTQIGVTALAVAGLTQAADRVFGWSSGWLRYMTTVTAMENLTRTFELDWATYLLQKTDALGTDDVRALFGLARTLEDKVAKLQADETAKWVTEFNSSMALLSELIKTQREDAEQQVQKAEAALSSRDTAKALGGLSVTLKHTGAPVPVEILLDDGPPMSVSGASWVKNDLQPGRHAIVVRLESNPGLTAQRLFNVAPGEIHTVEIEVPVPKEDE